MGQWYVWPRKAVRLTVPGTLSGRWPRHWAVWPNREATNLFPLRNDNYPSVDHAQDVVRRQSRRSGMILNRQELLALVHLPSPAVKSVKLVRDKGDSKAAPSVVRSDRGILLGHNLHAGQAAEVRLSQEQRVRHMHIIGASGTGKSTLLYNLIRQDIVNGEGLAVLDPHGDLIEQILGVIPSHRIEDVVLLDLSDEEYSIGFNILSAHSELEKTLLSSDLASVFKRLSSSWGDQMHSVLTNAILAFLESSQGGTLPDMRRFLLETSFREKFLQTVSDPEVVYYWRRAFPQLGGNKSIGPLMTRLEMFLGQKPIRYMVSQSVNRLDFADIMDSGKIFLAKLPQGQIGKENAYLFGSLLMSKFQQQAMSRQSQASIRASPVLALRGRVPSFHNAFRCGNFDRREKVQPGIDSRSPGIAPVAAGFGRGRISPLQCRDTYRFSCGRCRCKGVGRRVLKFRGRQPAEARNRGSLSAGLRGATSISISGCRCRKTNQTLIRRRSSVDK